MYKAKRIKILDNNVLMSKTGTQYSQQKYHKTNQINRPKEKNSQLPPPKHMSLKIKK